MAPQLVVLVLASVSVQQRVKGKDRLRRIVKINETMTKSKSRITMHNASASASEPCRPVQYPTNLVTRMFLNPSESSVQQPVTVKKIGVSSPRPGALMTAK